MGGSLETHREQRSRVTTWTEKEVDGLRTFFKRAALYPRLDETTQLPHVFNAYEEERRQTQRLLATGVKFTTTALTDLKNNEQFQETINNLPAGERKKFITLFMDSTSVEQLLTLTNLRLVSKIASIWQTAFLTYEDRLQAGYPGLIEGIRKWNPKKGELSAHATQRIKNHIDYAVAEAGYSTKIPKDIMWDLRLVHKLSCEFEETYGYYPSSEQVIQLFIEHRETTDKDENTDVLKKEKQRERRARNALSVNQSRILQSRSLEETIFVEDPERIKQQADPTANTETDAIRLLDSTEVASALSQLSDEEADVLHLYYWGELTLKAIAEKMGKPETNVRRIERRAKRKIKRYLSTRTQLAY